MITLEQLNTVPRPDWLTAYELYSGMADFNAQARDSRVRSAGWDNAIDVMDSVKALRDMPQVGIYAAAGRSFDEKIEFLQHAKAVAALFENPKVRFYR